MPKRVLGVGVEGGVGGIGTREDTLPSIILMGYLLLWTLLDLVHFTVLFLLLILFFQTFVFSEPEHVLWEVLDDALAVLHAHLLLSYRRQSGCNVAIDNYQPATDNTTGC